VLSIHAPLSTGLPRPPFFRTTGYITVSQQNDQQAQLLDSSETKPTSGHVFHVSRKAFCLGITYTSPVARGLRYRSCVVHHRHRGIVSPALFVLLTRVNLVPSQAYAEHLLLVHKPVLGLSCSYIMP